MLFALAFLVVRWLSLIDSMLWSGLMLLFASGGFFADRKFWGAETRRKPAASGTGTYRSGTMTPRKLSSAARAILAGADVPVDSLRRARRARLAALDRPGGAAAGDARSILVTCSAESTSGWTRPPLDWP